MSLIPPLYGFPPTLWVSWVLIFVAHGGGICSARMRAYSQLLSPGSLIRNLLRANEGLLLVHPPPPPAHFFPKNPLTSAPGGAGEPHLGGAPETLFLARGVSRSHVH